jgi:hypothetical protein
MQSQGRLGLMRSTLQKISVDGSDAPSTTQLVAIGASDGGATFNCETLSLDYTEGEYLQKVEFTYENGTPSVRVAKLTSSTGKVLEKGTLDGVNSPEFNGIYFDETIIPVGFEGVGGKYFF